MRKIRFTIMAAVMAAIFITSGCVKNEESEGVKELRMGQAALLQARATATTMEAEAEAAYTMALAAVQEAQAQMNLANARQTEIWNELQEADNEITIAELQLELEVLQATQESEIAVAVAEAKELLNAAEISLLESIRDLEVAIAEDDNALLKEYLDLYKDAMAEVVAARDDIIDETEKLARYQIYVDGIGGDLVAEKQAEQEFLEKILGLQELYKVKLEAVLDDPAVTDDEFTEATAEVEEIKIEIAKLEAQKVILNEAVFTADMALQDAVNEYNSVKDIIAIFPGVIDEWTNNISFSGIIDDGEFDPTVNGLFNSKAWYDNEANPDLQSELDIVVDFIAYLQGQLDAALLMEDDVTQTYKDAYVAFTAAVDEYNEVSDNIFDLENNDLGLAEWYANVLSDIYDNQLVAMDNIVTNIGITKANIAELDITFASWESAIAAQETKIEQLEAELAYWESVANDYKVMFEGEMSDE